MQTEFLLVLKIAKKLQNDKAGIYKQDVFVSLQSLEYKYEFDPRTGKGQGLLTSEILEQCGYFMQEKMYG